MSRKKVHASQYNSTNFNKNSHSPVVKIADNCNEIENVNGTKDVRVMNRNITLETHGTKRFCVDYRQLNKIKQ